MRLEDFLRHAKDHGIYVNVGVDDHHLRPSNIEDSNTSLVVYPLPGGPGVWDISVPFDAKAAIFSFRSNHDSEMSGAKSGVVGVATRSQLEASTMSIGGHGTLSTSAYAATYSKKSAAIDLSHLIFSSAGDAICLTDAWLYQTAPSTRVLRTQWTNYSGSLATLNVWAEIGILG